LLDCHASISRRHAHPELRRTAFVNDNDVQWHGDAAFKPDWSDGSRLVAYTLKNGRPEGALPGVCIVTIQPPHNLLWLPDSDQWTFFARACIATPLSLQHVNNANDCCCFAGGGLYVAFNTGHTARCVELPHWPGRAWKPVIDTSKLTPYDILMPDEELAVEEIQQVSRQGWKIPFLILASIVQDTPSLFMMLP
jgi:hypothetical protein